MSLPPHMFPLPPVLSTHIQAFFLYFYFCLTTGTQPLPKKFLHTARSSASSFTLQHPLISLRASSGFLTSSSSSSGHDYLSLYLSFNNVLWKAVPLHKKWPIQLASFLFIVCSTFLFSSTLCNSLQFSRDQSSNWSSPSFPTTTFQNFANISGVQVSAPHTAMLQM